MVADKKLATGTSRDDPQTQTQTQPLAPEELAEENAATSLDQPSEGSQ